MRNTLVKLAIGGSGLIASGVTEQLTQINATQATEATSLIVQILIGIATLFGLFRKKAKK